MDSLPRLLRRFGLATRLLCWTYTAGLLLWFVAGRTFGDQWWWLALLNTFALYVFLPLPLAWGLAALSRRRSASIAVGLASALLLWLYGGMFLPRASGAHAAGPTLTVLTYNIPFPLTGRRESALLDAIAAQEADIVFIQEGHAATVDRMRRALLDRYPYSMRWTGERERGNAILSRYPLHFEATLEAANPNRPTQVVAADVDGRELLLVNTHPTATNGTSRWLELPRFVDETYAAREREVAEVLAYLEGESRPIILAGDLNMTDQTAAYRALARRYRDSWREVGFGFGNTFPAHPIDWHGIPIPFPLLRIDYVFHSGDIEALEAWHVSTAASDHRGLAVKLLLR